MLFSVGLKIVENAEQSEGFSTILRADLKRKQCLPVGRQVYFSPNT